MSEAPARHLNLAGASNFRDLGGYQTRDGRTVRWRQIFRSNHLAHLTEQDVAVVRTLGVKSAFDFRGVTERAEALCGMTDITVHSLPVEPTVVAAQEAEDLSRAAVTVAAAPDATRVTTPAPQAPPTPAAAVERLSGPWKVQLGAFGVPGNAEKLWSQLAGRSEIAGRERVLLKSGRLTRLLAGGYASREDASAACASLKRSGQACLVTR